MRKEVKPTCLVIPTERLAEIDWHVDGANLRAKDGRRKPRKELETRSSFIRAAIDHYLFCVKGLQKIL